MDWTDFSGVANRSALGIDSPGAIVALRGHRMSAAIPITRLNRTASELRIFASKCRDGAQVRRLLAIALVMEGRSRAEAAGQNGMDGKR